MYCNKLKLNSNKLELPSISSCYWPHRLLTSLKICSSAVQSALDCNLGVVFEESLMFEKHSAVCKSAFYHLRRIAEIRIYLSEESTIALIHAFITCRKDNVNAVLHGLPKCQIQRLQSVLNCAVGLIKRLSKWSIALFLRSYYWFFNL